MKEPGIGRGRHDLPSEQTMGKPGSPQWTPYQIGAGIQLDDISTKK
jgi:hypothetical protein